jgi:hypothetical protein
MTAIRATWKGGKIVPDGPVDWPEGCRLLIEPDLDDSGPIGIREEDWSDSPEAIADWLAWYDSLEPLILTPEEEADLAAWRQRIKEYTIAKVREQFEEHPGGTS